MNPLRIFLYNLYLLQLENYRIGRFWQLLWDKARNNLFGLPQRQKIVWTAKAKLIFSLSLVLLVLLAWSQTSYFHTWYLQVGFFIFYFFIYSTLLAPLFLIIATLIIWPVDAAVKAVVIGCAKRKIAKFKNLKIIGITGSYGKTSMKEWLAPILSQKYKILKTPENINTPLGISRLILSHLDRSVEILIVEMGAYRKGDIRQLCEIASPDIAILTGINEAHLELFGNIKNTIDAKFEIIRFAKPGALALLNADNDLVKNNYARFAGDHKILWYKNTGTIPFNLKPRILGGYVSAVLNACVIIAEELGLTEDQIKAGISRIKPVAHRLELIENPNGVTVIDDSYNGNPEGVKEAIRVLAGFSNQRKVYITPGLVEMGQEKGALHRKIGEQLATVADCVILIKNSVTPYIAEGLKSKGFDTSKIIWFERATEAHARLSEIIKPGDVVMFQNDWPDNYL